MLDSKQLRADPAAVAANLARRGFTLDVGAFTMLDELRKKAQVESDRVRAERNANAKAVGMAKGKGEDASSLLARAEELTNQLASSDAAIAKVQEELDAWQLGLPNTLHASVPDGRDETANVEVRKHGSPASSTSRRKTTSSSARSSGGLDFEIAAKISGAASPSCAAGSRGCIARWRNSCSTCTRANMATRSCTCRTWSARRRCRARASCRNSKPTCSACRASRASI